MRALLCIYITVLQIQTLFATPVKRDIKDWVTEIEEDLEEIGIIAKKSVLSEVGSACSKNEPCNGDLFCDNDNTCQYTITAIDEIACKNDSTLPFCKNNEGDGLIPDVGGNGKRSALGYNCFWPSGLVPYFFREGDFTEGNKTIIRIAIMELNDLVEHINIEEVQEDSIHEYKVEIIAGSGCYSYIGIAAWLPNNVQPLSLGQRCVHNYIIQHEFLHALGFFHEQSRPDRDEYVTINFTNIKENKTHNFEIHNDSNRLGEQYDVQSIMHYHSWAFSKNDETTILLKDGSKIYTNTQLSPSDIDGVTKLYSYADCNFCNCSKYQYCNFDGVSCNSVTRECKCDAGYTGSATDCQAIVSCSNCNSETEECVAPNTCECKTGYERDNNDECVEVVSCSNCNSETEECVASMCECKHGYQRDANGQCAGSLVDTTGLVDITGPDIIQSTSDRHRFPSKTITIEGYANGNGKYHFCVRVEATGEDIPGVKNVIVWASVRDKDNGNAKIEKKTVPLTQTLCRKYIDDGIERSAHVVERIYQFETDLAVGNTKNIALYYGVNPRAARKIGVILEVFRDDDETGNACHHRMDAQSNLLDTPSSKRSSEVHVKKSVGSSKDASIGAVLTEKLAYTDILTFDATELSGYSTGAPPSQEYTFCARTMFYAEGLDLNDNIPHSANAKQYDDDDKYVRLQKPVYCRSKYLRYSEEQEELVLVFQDSITFKTEVTEAAMNEFKVNLVRTLNEGLTDVTLHLIEFSVYQVTDQNSLPCVPFSSYDLELPNPE